MAYYRKGLKKKFDPEKSNPFEAYEMIRGVYRYETQISGVSYASVRNPVYRRTHVVKEFLQDYGYKTSFHGKKETEVYDLKLMKEGLLSVMEDRISPFIKIVVEKENPHDRNAMQVQVMKDNIIDLESGKPGGWIDVGYVPKHHKERILADYVTFFLIKAEGKGRGLWLSFLLVANNFVPVKVNKPDLNPKAAKKFKKASFTSVRALRNALEVD